MFLSDPPASDLAEALYDEDRESDGYVSNTTRLWCWRPDVLKDFFGVRRTLSGASGLSPADQAVLFAAAPRRGRTPTAGWPGAPGWPVTRARTPRGRS